MWKRNDKTPSYSIVIGYLKTCSRKLYLADTNGKTFITKPVTIADFFVHPDYQRQGCGLELFNNMLEV